MIPIGFRNSIIRIAVSAAPLAFLVACASVDIPAANQLATSGVAASAAAQETTETTRADLIQVLRIETLRSALQPGISPPSQKMTDDIEEIRRKLAARSGMFGDLKDLYRSFLALASYDAAGEFTSAATETRTSINAFANALQKASPFGDVAGPAIDTGAGIIGEEIQKRKIRSASQTVRQALEQVVALLDSPEEAETMTAIRQAITQQYALGTMALWDAGVLNAKDRIAGLVRVEGFAVVPSVTSSDPKIRDAIDKDIEFALEQRMELQEMAHQQTVGTMKALIDRHHELEEEKPLSLEQLLDELNRLVELAQTIKGT
jgi:hypothetical protein